MRVVQDSHGREWHIEKIGGVGVRAIAELDYLPHPEEDILRVRSPDGNTFVCSAPAGALEAMRDEELLRLIKAGNLDREDE